MSPGGRVDEVVVLDAVGVAATARAARDVRHGEGGGMDAALQLLPEAIAEHVRRLAAADPLPSPAHDALHAYATELEDIAEAAVALDQHENEIEHQLRWWTDRAGALESSLTGHPGDDVDIVRELALYRGRISGAHTMRRHYTQQRRALLARHVSADTACAAGLAVL
jgi:hypothetical protein